MTAQATYLHPDVFTIDGFFDADECAKLISDSESTSYEEATIMTSVGAAMAKEVRNNDRVLSDDPAMAARLWERLRTHLPATYRGSFRPVGLNERLRFYRYGPGQKFDWHRDGPFIRNAQEGSLLTFMVYLNEACEGGETLFRDLPASTDGSPAPSELAVKPRTGTALLFFHPLWHTGAEVRSGVKYVLRSDVMFERSGPVA